MQVYGDPEISPQPEEYWGKVNCIGVRSCYDEGKRAAETLCFDYHRMNGAASTGERLGGGGYSCCMLSLLSPSPLPRRRGHPGTLTPPRVSAEL